MRDFDYFAYLKVQIPSIQLTIDLGAVDKKLSSHLAAFVAKDFARVSFVFVYPAVNFLPCLSLGFQLKNDKL